MEVSSCYVRLEALVQVRFGRVGMIISTGYICSRSREAVQDSNRIREEIFLSQYFRLLP